MKRLAIYYISMFIHFFFANYNYYLKKQKYVTSTCNLRQLFIIDVLLTGNRGGGGVLALRMCVGGGGVRVVTLLSLFVNIR